MTEAREVQKPWTAYRRETNWKDLIPGYAGALDDEQVAYIQGRLMNDASLRLWWGMKPSWKRVPEEAIRRVAMSGCEYNQSLNRKLAQPRKPKP
ncbi:MAG TPA: hypothetical protein VFA32_07650 [Dehalococcoidia bacterium]|nr:hypothetical protein [Dehalococcoidia bacterium]